MRGYLHDIDIRTLIEWLAARRSTGELLVGAPDDRIWSLFWDGGRLWTSAEEEPELLPRQIDELAVLEEGWFCFDAEAAPPDGGQGVEPAVWLDRLTARLPLPPVPPAPTGRVVCIDDSTAVQRWVAAGLEGVCCEIHACSDPLQALALFREAPADLVLLDRAMPGLDGRRLCRVLRQLPGLNRMPVLLMIDGDERTEQAHARLCGAAAVLAKPFSQGALRSLVARWLPGAPPG
ncbi:response regulator [Gloeobacter morelensis]|uniref:Response regulator n=1 Tax=Gloeobacter morelensis MG652769 TaxID=2781736 RepID=A0ABY3PR18_9CYAN|nr:response regulator [Gloeobacter morelensis]UFP96170.1 response regulator [Gloeobacter morelensis MG652769]